MATVNGKKSNLKQSLNTFASRFKLGSHYTIERMGVITATIVVAGTLVAGGTGYYAAEAGKADISQVASYSQAFTTSRTGQAGSVEGVYADAAGTRALVMMKFTNPKEMSARAEDYYVYVSGVNGNGSPTKVAQASVGSIYSFGDSGYLGVLLEAPSGFDLQVLNLTIRAKKELVPPVQMSEEEMNKKELDSTFALHDQWRLMVNPVASQTLPLEALNVDGEQPSIRQIWAETVLAKKEAEHRRKLDGEMAKLNALLDRINTYAESAATVSVDLRDDLGVRLIPPPLPPLIAGDEIVGMSASELTQALVQDPTGNSVEGLADKSEAARRLDTFPDHMVNTYRLRPGEVASGGYDFDWRSRTVAEGYLDAVIPAGEEPVTWMTEHAYQPKQTWSARDMEWPLSNGMLLKDFNRSDPAVKPLHDLVNNYTQALQNYHKLKVDHQRTSLQKLLLMEAELNTVARNTTTATGTGAVEYRL